MSCAANLITPSVSWKCKSTLFLYTTISFKEFRSDRRHPSYANEVEAAIHSNDHRPRPVGPGRLVCSVCLACLVYWAGLACWRDWLCLDCLEHWTDLAHWGRCFGCHGFRPGYHHLYRRRFHRCRHCLHLREPWTTTSTKEPCMPQRPDHSHA